MLFTLGVHCVGIVESEVLHSSEFEMITIAFIVAAYLIGSLSFAVIVSYTMGLADPRTFGSKNPGATNVLRTGKKWAAVLTLLGDGIKGAVAVWLAQWLAPRYGLADPEIAMVGIAVLLGHMWPVFFRFHGGKGVATALGVLCAFNPWLALAALLTWLAVAFISRLSSLAALTAALTAPLYAYFLMPNSIYFGTCLIIALLLVKRHKQNILNLISGKETRIGAASAVPSASED